MVVMLQKRHISFNFMCCFSQKRFTHTFFVAKQFTHTFLSRKRLIHTLFCRENDPRTFVVAKTILVTIFLSQKRFVKRFCKRVFVAIYAVRPENFCALKFAIRKVQTFWASWVSKQ